MSLIFSIIIPVYNVELYLRDCLNSVVIQSIDKDKFEVIIINDCSPDNSEEIIKEYLDKQPNFKYIKHTENKGLGPARNSGIEIARGDYLLFLDSDDMFESDALKELSAVILSSPGIEYIRFNHTKIINGEKVNNQNLKLHFKNIIEQQCYLYSLPCYAWAACISNNFIKKHKFMFLSILNEDVPWTILLISKAKFSVLIDIRIYGYRIRQNSITTNKNYNINDYIDSYRISTDMLPDTNQEAYFLKHASSKIINFSWVKLIRRSMPISKENKAFLKKVISSNPSKHLKISLKKILLKNILLR